MRANSFKQSNYQVISMLLYYTWVPSNSEDSNIYEIYKYKKTTANSKEHVPYPYILQFNINIIQKLVNY